MRRRIVMENLATYQKAVVKEKPFLIREESRESVKLRFERAIARFNRQLKAIEKRSADPAESPDELLSATTAAIDAMMGACKEFEREFAHDSDAVKTAQIRFREKTRPLLSKSYCVNRCRTWPQGYQGDYKTLETAYRNTPLSEGIGYYLDKYMLSAPLAGAVRGRIEKLRELLSRELSARKSPAVLDIACGSCREVIELVPEIKQSVARFTCVDLDSEALDFALQRLAHAGLPADQLELLTYNALRIFDYETAAAEFGTKDVIYSVGFFDYLPDEFLVKLLRTLYLLLNPGGKLIAAFKDAERYRSQDYHWLVDWDGFRQRKTADFERLLRQADIPASAVEECRDASGTIIFYSAVRRIN